MRKPDQQSGDRSEAWYRQTLTQHYPSRETALRIISALDKGEASTATELAELSGVPDVMQTAERCHWVFGYPELDPSRIARRLAEVFMRPCRLPAEERHTPRATPSLNEGLTPIQPSNHTTPGATDGYGFQQRK